MLPVFGLSTLTVLRATRISVSVSVWAVVETVAVWLQGLQLAAHCTVMFVVPMHKSECHRANEIVAVLPATSVLVFMNDSITSAGQQFKPMQTP